jgi:peptidoglycan hydrolase CwlO-like protein
LKYEKVKIMKKTSIPIVKICARSVIVVFVAAAVVGCASGDSLFSDAGSVHSGRYDREMAAKRTVVEQGHSRIAALSGEQKELQTRMQDLDDEIARQKRSVKGLQNKVAELDNQILQLTTESVEARKKQSEIHLEVADLQRELAVLENRVASNPSPSELEILKQREQELAQTYSDLLAIYKSM